MSEVHLTTAQLAKRWGVSEKGLANQRQDGDVPHPRYLKLGKGRAARVRYRLVDIEEFERECMQGGSSV